MKKPFFFTLLILVFNCLHLHADVITSIEIIGLRRTRLHIAKHPLEKFIGQDKSAFDQNEVFAAVMNMGILEPVSAELVETPDDLVLRITVEERWSIFPFPLIFADSGETNFGLFFVDTNAFGMRDMAVLGGMYGSGGWSAITMYIHTPNRRGVPGWNCMFMYSRHERETTDRNEVVHRRFTADWLRCSFGLNYIFVDNVTGSVNISFTNISIKDTDNALNQPENGVMLIGFNPGLSFRQSSWDGFFLSNRSISLEYSYNLAVSGSSFHQIDFRGNYEHSLVPGFRLKIRSAGVWKSTSNPLFEDGPQSASVNILPRSYSAQRYAGLSTGLERYLFRRRWGTLSCQASWQGVFSYSLFSGLEFDHGPSGGLLFYLSRVALPAMGINLSYNLVSGLFQFSFSMGMSF